MTSYFNIFNGNPVQPSQVSYQELTLTQDEILNWTTSGLETPNIVSLIIDLISEDASYTLTMPDATQVSTGQAIILRNIGDEDITILDQGGNTIATVEVGIAIYLYLTDNTTVNGTWGNVTFGAGTASVDAPTLAGLGLVAIGQKLNTNIPPNVLGTLSNYNVTANDRAGFIIWTSGVGTITLPSTSVGAGYYVCLHNASQIGGQVTLLPTGSGVNIDNFTQLQVDPGQSLMIVLVNSNNWYSLGFGQETFYAVNVLSLDVSGNTDTVLTNEQASKLIQIFTGVLTGDKDIIYPTVANQYYPYNQTTGDFNLGLALETGPSIPIAQGQRLIIACDGNTLNSYPSTPTPSTIIFPDGAENEPSVTFEGDTLSGLFLAGVGLVSTTISGSEAFRVASTGITIFEDGTQLLPSITWNDENTLGFYRFASNSIGVASNSITPLVIDDLGVGVINGSAAQPSITFLSQNNKGMYNAGSNLLGFSVNAVETLILATTGLQTIDGITSNPSYAFIDFPDTGMYTKGIDDVSFASAGVDIAEINALGLTIYDGLELFFTNPAGTFTTSFKSAVTLANTSYTLPLDYPGDSGQALISTDAGIMSWSVAIFDADGIKFPDGTQTDPSIAFIDEPNTGFLHPSAGIIGCTVLGSDILAISASGISLQEGNGLFFYNPAGTFYTAIEAGGTSVNTVYDLPLDYPTVSGQPLISTDTGTMSWATSSFDANGIKVPNGTQANPSISFTNYPATGFFSENPDELSGVANGEEIFTLTSNFMFMRSGKFLAFINPADTFFTSLIAGANLGNLDFTLPINYPTASGQPLVSTTGGVWSWATTSFGTNSITIPNGAATITHQTPAAPAANYTYVWPVDAPVAGDALRVTSVVGTTVTLEWAP